MQTKLQICFHSNYNERKELFFYSSSARFLWLSFFFSSLDTINFDSVFYFLIDSFSIKNHVVFAYSKTIHCVWFVVVVAVGGGAACCCCCLFNGYLCSYTAESEQFLIDCYAFNEYDFSRICYFKRFDE